MKKSRQNRIVFFETVDPSMRGRLRKYEKAYAYAGDCAGVEKLPYDFKGTFDKYQSQYEMGECIDWVYNQYVHANEAKILIESMKHKEAALILKRQIYSSLSKLFMSFMMVKKFQKEYKINGVIDFVPEEFSYSLFKILQRRQDLLPKNVRLPKWYLRKLKVKETFRTLFFILGFFLYPLGVSFLMNFRMNKKMDRKQYIYGVHIHNTAFTFIEPPYEYGFLESEKGLNRSNALYIMEGKMNLSNLKKIKSNGYDCCYFKEMIRQFSVWEYLKRIYGSVFKMSIKMLSVVLSARPLVIESYLKVLRRYLIWEIFYSNYDVKNFISNQEAGENMRVFCRKMHNSHDIFIYLSSVYDPFEKLKLKNHIATCYNYMFYDTFMSCLVTNNYFKGLNNSIGQFYNCGIIHSDIGFRVKHNSELKSKLREEMGIAKNKKVIAFVSGGGIGRKSLFNNEEGYKLINDLYRLIDSNKDYFLIFRPLIGQKSSAEFAVDIEMKKLISHSRVVFSNEVAPHKYAYDIAGLCDLFIGTCYSSATQEAVCAGVPTFCYAPFERMEKHITYVNKIPKYWARDFEQLSEFTNYWLYQCDDRQFSDFQEEYVKKYFDSFCDGQASKRVQAYLEKLNHSGEKGKVEEPVEEVVTS